MKRAPLLSYAKAVYFKAIDLLHRPFVKQGAADPYHVVHDGFVALGRSLPAPSVLELGSRNVTGVTRRGLFPDCREYVGFDIMAGDGVDVVGDVHCLGNYFPASHFDLVFAISVFEHLLFPWKAVLEVNKVMRTGGYLHVCTHPAWPEHEMPWDFWRFPHQAFHALLNTYTGFEITAIAEGLPCKAYSLVDDGPTRRLWLHSLNQGVAVTARKTGIYRSDLLKWEIEAREVIGTDYPRPAKR